VTSLDGLTGGATVSGEAGSASDAGAPHDGASGGGSGGGSGSSSGGSGGDSALDATSGDDAAGGGDASGSGGGSDSGDASTGSETGSDSARLVDAGWCATQTGVIYCADFDEGPLASNFDTITSKGGAATLDTGNPLSAPNVMLVQTSTGAQTVDVAGYHAFPSLTLASGMVLTASADIRVEQVDQTNKSDAVPFEIQLYDPFRTDWELELELVWNAGAGALDVNLVENADLPDGGNPWYSTAGSAKIPLDTWKRVTIELTLGPAALPISARLLLDGTVIATVAKLHPATVGATAEVIVGTSWVNPGNAAWNMRFDDVTFATQ
jgi:hypothetical protein